MNLRGPRRQEDIEIFITPFVDVLLVLLLFFVVTTTFVRYGEIELTLPEAARDTRPQTVDLIEVSIDREGHVWVNGTRLPDSGEAALRAGMAAAARDIEHPTVVIAADENATHQSVINVMDVARQLGLNRITFPTRDRDVP